jgi:hypothetical protein
VRTADYALSKINMDYGILFKEEEVTHFLKRRNHATTPSHLESRATAGIMSLP